MAEAIVDVSIIGAGPYGLSLAAYLKDSAASFRIFGAPMQTWRDHMPKGMVLKSDGFASSLADPQDRHTLEAYCKENAIAYHPMHPPSLEVFIEYALDFQRRLAPMVEPVDVDRVERFPQGYRLTLNSGEQVLSRRVVLAVGISHFDTLPAVLANLPEGLASHSAAHSDPGALAGKSIAIIGAGATAVELAVLIQEVGGQVHLLARSPELRFFSGPPGAKRSLWKQIRHPKSGLGPGVRSRLLSDLPDLFRKLSPVRRKKIVTFHLGPASAFHLKARLAEQVRVHLATRIDSAEPVENRVRLHLIGPTDGPRTLDVDHVIAATGYPPAVGRWSFLDSDLGSAIQLEFDNPKLSACFETTVPGLYVIGLGSAMSFGPLCRFVYGARFTARRLSRHLARAASLP